MRSQLLFVERGESGPDHIDGHAVRVAGAAKEVSR
jgi:hypothetical protein